MSDAGKAVFLSYASQDAEAAKRIADALRAAGIEVWFDQSELTGGDAWDGKIRKQIKECALLIPVISANTQERTEGYFRLEWRLADQRTHLMAKGRAFLLPVVIDGTKDTDAHVPDSFTEVQWTRLPGGEAGAAFATRVKKLLGASELEAGRPRPAERGEGAASPIKTKSKPIWPWVVSAVVVLSLAYFIFRPQRSAGEIAKVAAPTQTSGSKPEVAQILGRVRAATDKIDVLRTELDTMEGLLEQAAKLDPTDATVWAQWARLDCIYLDKYYDRTPARRDAARRHVAQAAGLDPKAAAVRHAQAIVMRHLASDAATWTEAGKILQQLWAEAPQDGRVALELGWNAFQLDQMAAAFEWFDRAAQLPGFAGPAHFARARVLVYTGKTDQAGAEFDRALESGRAAEVLLWKAFILTIWNGDLAAARKALADVPPQFFVEDMPAATRYYVALLSRDYDSALAAVRNVPHDYLQSVAYSGPAGYFAGNALALAGKTAAAELEWRTALATVERRLAAEPNGRALMEMKALLQAALGDRDAGRKTWLAVRELYGDNDTGNFEPLLHVQLQPAAEALTWLERMVDSRANVIIAAQLRLEPAYDSLRGDPRFAAVLAKAEADPRLSPNAPRQAITVPKVDDKSVAVLAFANLSDDKANEYFSDGISEELLNVLAKVPGLKVTARTSSFHFKGTNTAIPEIAQQLGVAYVIEGSVRKQGDKVRITAQLIKASDGFHVWSDTFTRDLKDIFAVQDEIAGLIAKQLSLKLETSSPAATASVKPEAFELYVQARQAIARRDVENFDRAEQLLGRALELEPGLARAHAALADVWTLRANLRREIGYFGQREAPVFSRVEAEIAKALDLDPDSAEAHASLGFARLHEWKLADAERELRRAVALNPNYPTGHHWLAACLINIGWIDEGLAEYQRAAELDPFSFRILENYGSALEEAGRREESLAYLNRALQLQPKSTQALANKAITLSELNRRSEAIAIIRELPESNARFLFAGAGLQAEAEAALAKATGRDRNSLLAGLDRYDEWLDAITPADINVFGLRGLLLIDQLDPVRHDPRFTKLIATLGVTEAHVRAQAWRAAHPPAKK